MKFGFFRTVWQRARYATRAALFFCLVGGKAVAVLADTSAWQVRSEGNTLSVKSPGEPAAAWRQTVLTGRITATAVSGSGQSVVVAVATDAPLGLHFLDANLRLLQTLRLRDRSASFQSPVCTILVAEKRQSFVIVFSAMPELWEVSYNTASPEIGIGMVHDFQYREGHFVPGYLNPLRSSLPAVVRASALSVDGNAVLIRGIGQEGANAPAKEFLLHLDVRKPINEVQAPAYPLQSCEIR